DEIGAPWYVKLIMRLLSLGIRKKAKRLNVGFSFLFMKANGGQLKEITDLINAGAVTPVIDKVFPFELIKEAIAYVEGGHAKGKVAVKMK
ncbi:MAG: zinc-binding dehydrogenase, partial [Mucilaginibacter sp.]